VVPLRIQSRMDGFELLKQDHDNVKKFRLPGAA
jgi:hypothetical protein